MPLSAGSAASSVRNALRPPAEAPIATVGKTAALIVAAIGFRCAGRRLAECSPSRAVEPRAAIAPPSGIRTDIAASATPRFALRPGKRTEGIACDAHGREARD